MKRILDHTSNRWGYDGWALKVIGSDEPMAWSMCTTRKECRELKRDIEGEMPDLFRRLEVVKVKVKVWRQHDYESRKIGC